ncbi:MAG: peroxiredoxin [Planctomycetota bacterium]|nr:MAG: peroxiredoxin [Planctomycetota bacterium]
MDNAPTPTASILRLGDIAPDFEASTTHGPLSFHEWKGDSWCLLFSHPADFTPVCTTEFVGFASRADEFAKRNVKLIGNSIDSVFSHIAWMRNIEQTQGVKVGFPVIADLDQKVAQAYGMVHEPVAVTATVRTVFFIDPEHVLRAMIYYPLSAGRNIDEIMQLIDAMQTSDVHGVATPAGWKPGDDVIIPPPATAAAADERVADESLKLTDWYFAKKSL